MAESEEELKSLLMKVKEENGKIKTQHSENLDHSICFHHVMTNRWGSNGNSDRLYLGGSKITADSDCSHEIKRHLRLGRKAMINLDSILKRRNITLPAKVRLAKAVFFPVVMYGCDSWTIKKAERQRIGSFERWCWRRLLRVTWTARRSNQSILKDISPEYSLEMNISARAETPILWPPWCEELTHWKRSWFWERLKVGGEGDDRGWDGWMSSLTQWTWVWVNSRSWWWTGRPGMLQSMGLQRVKHDWLN